MPIITGPDGSYIVNGWHVLQNVWNPKSYVFGRDYSLSATFSADNPVSGTRFDWSFPTGPSAYTNLNVYAYPEVLFGVSPWWGSTNPTDPLNVFPIAVADITALTADYDLSFDGELAGCDVSYEMWLTSVPGGGSATITNEIMIWFHKGAFGPDGATIAIYSDQYFTGAIHNAPVYGDPNHPWNYTAIAANSDSPTGRIDIAAMLQTLKALGVIDGTEYLATVELGVEIAAGQGSLTVSKLEYHIQLGGGATTILGGTTGTALDDIIPGMPGNDTLSGLGGADLLYGYGGNDTLLGDDEHDTLTGGAGNDVLDGGANVDTAIFSGNYSGYTITQGAIGVFTVGGSDGTDVLINVEYAQFGDQTVRLLPGSGTAIDWAADPSTYMTGIRDFDGNDLGSASGWKLIGTADVNGDGTVEHILVNRTNGRWAEVCTEADGKTYFNNNGWAGDTRVVGIYIDPLVISGEVVAGSDFDSQRRFQNDLNIENIHGVLGQADYNHDGLQEIYFSLTDGTAYLHAYMHADGNIQYANYQNEQQVKDYLTSNGFTAAVWAGWFPAAQNSLAAIAG